MRLRHAAPVLAGGLIIGWTALAQAAPNGAPPPAAPIFYCPSAPGAAAAPKPAKAAPPIHPAHVEGGCPTGTVPRVSLSRFTHERPVRRHVRYEVQLITPPAPPPPERYGPPPVREARAGDVSASQAFIYRYERAQGGLNTRAAHEAWNHPNGFWPHGPAPVAPEVGREGPPPGPDGLAWRGQHEHDGGPRGPVDHLYADQGRGAAEGQHWYERDGHADVRAEGDLPPLPPTPPAHPDHEDHAGAHQDQGANVAAVAGYRYGYERRDQEADRRYAAAEAEAQRRADHWRDERRPVPPPPPIPPQGERDGHAWAHEDHGDVDAAGGAYGYERRESVTSGGYAEGEVDGHAYARRWGDADAGQGRDSAYAEGDADADAGHERHVIRREQQQSGGQDWQDGGYGEVAAYAGRDAHGYLVWPDKTPEQDVVQ